MGWTQYFDHWYNYIPSIFEKLVQESKKIELGDYQSFLNEISEEQAKVTAIAKRLKSMLEERVNKRW